MDSKGIKGTAVAISFLAGLIGGCVTAVWAIEDRIEKKISDRLAPFESSVNEIKVDIRDIKQFLFSLANPEWRRN